MAKINKNFWVPLCVSIVLYAIVQVMFMLGFLDDVAESTLFLIGINIILVVINSTIFYL